MFKRKIFKCPMITLSSQSSLPQDSGDENTVTNSNISSKAHDLDLNAHKGVNKKPCTNQKALSASKQRLKHVQSGAAQQADAAVMMNIGNTPASGLKEATYYKVLYIKQDSFFKKRAQKQYSDGFLVISQDFSAMLYNQDGKVSWTGRSRQVSGEGASAAAKSAFNKRLQLMRGSNGPKRGSSTKADCDEEPEELEDDDCLRFELNSLIAEVDQVLDPELFRSGACFLRKGGGSASGIFSTTVTAHDRPPPSHATRQFIPPTSSVTSAAISSAEAPSRPAVPARHHHAPQAPGALLLNDVQWDNGKGVLLPVHQQWQPMLCSKSNGIVGSRMSTLVAPVVVDPYLGRALRPHQREGIQFLYKCTMEQESGIEGCLLADEMGLGKTLQVITLIWTMLKQSPIEGQPAVHKVIVVTPATLVNQWAKEVTKWLGSERLKANVLMQGPKADEIVEDFVAVRGNYQHAGLLVTSYEAVRKYSSKLKGSCDLLVCDEAHRLKSSGGNQTVRSLMELGCNKRILLTGTPVQNNLEEYYALLSFVAPEVLGSASQFKKIFSEPISKGRDRDATTEERKLGEERAEMMSKTVAPFVLRRTQAILARHLPPLHQMVVFCKPSDIQLKAYQHVLKKGGKSTSSNLSGEDSRLALITALRKVCNSLALLIIAQDSQSSREDLIVLSKDSSKVGAQSRGSSMHACRSVLVDDDDGIQGGGWLKGLPACQDDSLLRAIESSGKLHCLSYLLHSMLTAGERCVVVSTSTATLDIIDDSICKAQGFMTVRIDGSVNPQDRQGIVDGFNLHGRGQVFMLSTRAGGAGLNLIGANNLVLFDSDWNPAADEQAMARIWRDGQKRPCHVFRLLTTGTIEEKVYQRQIMKGDLATAVNNQQHVEGGSTSHLGKDCSSSTSNSCVTSGLGCSSGGAGGRQFTKEDLKHLFSLWPHSDQCETRILLDSSMIPCEQQPLQWLNLRDIRSVQQGVEDGDIRAHHGAPQGESQQHYQHVKGAVSSGLVTAVARVTKRVEVETLHCPLKVLEESRRDDEGGNKPLDPCDIDDEGGNKPLDPCNIDDEGGNKPLRLCGIKEGICLESVLGRDVGVVDAAAEKDICRSFSRKRPDSALFKDRLLKQWAVEEGVDLEL